MNTYYGVLNYWLRSFKLDIDTNKFFLIKHVLRKLWYLLQWNSEKKTESSGVIKKIQNFLFSEIF